MVAPPHDRPAPYLRSAPRGFTLVEMLIVVGIIGVLLAILIPSLSKLRATARTAACASNLRQISFGMNAYAQDTVKNNRTFFPPCAWRDTDATINGQHYMASLIRGGYVQLEPAVAGGATPRSVFVCPEGLDQPGDINGVLVPVAGYPSGIIRALPQPLYAGFNGYWENTNAADPSRPLYRTWYGVNGSNYRHTAMPRNGNNTGNVGGDVNSNRLRLSQIRKPESLVLIFDGFGAMFSNIAIPYAARHNYGTIVNCLLTDNVVISVKVADLPQGRFDDADTDPAQFPKWHWESVVK